MVAENDQPSIPARRLAERLRDLREREHLTQKQLARILGGAEALSIATISLWEKPGSDRLPPRAAARRLCPPVLHQPVFRRRPASSAQLR